jgi:hypothetical protein
LAFGVGEDRVAVCPCGEEVALGVAAEGKAGVYGGSAGVYEEKGNMVGIYRYLPILAQERRLACRGRDSCESCREDGRGLLGRGN